MCGGEVYAAETRWRKRQDEAESPWIRAPATSFHPWWRPSWAFLACGRRRCRGPGSCARSRGAGGASLDARVGPAGVWQDDRGARLVCEPRQRRLPGSRSTTRDNDPNRMWRYVATAVDRDPRRSRSRRPAATSAYRRLDRVGDRRADERDSPPTGRSASSCSTTRTRSPIPTVSPCLDYFVEHLPDAARLVLITRSDPPLRLARLRSRRAIGRAPSGRARVHERRGTKPPGRRRGAWRWSRRRSRRSARAPRAGRPRSFSPRSGWTASLIPPGRFASSEATSASSPTTSPRRCCSRSTPTCERFCCEPPSSGASRRRCATQCSTAPIRRPCWHGSSVRTSSSRGSSTGAGTGFTRCSPSSPASSWPRSTPGAERVLNRRAAEWLYAQRRPVEAASTRRGRANTSSSRVCWPSITSS